ncbi:MULTISPECIES: NAD(P)H-dependent flavin oxidoreductase [unclassified Sphingopyxis]|uniref:NAD(P)H-dependent flavin oxidoreductase n=1 Tax=unclassified Sphingopyxis TaxID=2614943 RepID=UPI0025EB0D5F|nr:MULTISPECIES: nitronate monooxygenase [unclassified Sphingopyxis]
MDRAARLAGPLAQCLPLTVPILSAPMAGIAGGALAAAVSRGGGLGLVGGGYGDRAWLERELAIAGDARVGVGFITWALAQSPDLLAVALDHRPAAILLSFGDVAPFAAAIARAGVPLIVQVQTVADARLAAAEGAAVIVAQGGEAGGHGGTRGTMALVPEVVDAVGAIPVVAAGGIADGRGIAAAFMLGASGALCGTAFYAADESLAHAAGRAALLAATGDHTVKGRVFDIARRRAWPADWTIRTLRNRFFDRWVDDPDGLKRQIDAAPDTIEAAARHGDTAVAPVIVGEAAGLIADTGAAATIVARLWADTTSRMAEVAGLD